MAIVDPKDPNIGKSVKRREDKRFLTGRGRFVDDIQLPKMLYSAVLRSQHAHAKLVSVNVEAAAAAPGVHMVLTGKDIDGKIGVIVPNWVVGETIVPERPVLAKDTVRFVGDPIAFVVAETRAQALDALELIDVDYHLLDAVVSEVDAFSTDGPVLHDTIPDNRCGVYEVITGDYQKAKDMADHIVTGELINNRLIPSALEPRCIIADYDTYDEKLTMHLPTQVPHMHRRWIAETLDWPENTIRIKAPDIGGGFGSKMHLYPEELLLPYASKLLGRPVKWTETRSEAHMSTTHGRAHTEFVEAAVTQEGKILGLKFDSFANMGAYLSNMATGIPTINCANFASGCYDIENAEINVNLMMTNTVPVDAYRGAGRPEAAYMIERTIDLVAQNLGLEPLAVRWVNMIQPDQFPYAPLDHPVLKFDSGNYQATLSTAKDMIGYDELRNRQKELRAEGRYVGIGLTNYNELCGVGPSTRIGLIGFDRGGYETAHIRVHPDGKVSFMTGSMSQGHGHETAFAQIISDVLQIPMDHIDVVNGDTDRIPTGIGTYNSRSIPVGGTAAMLCAQKIIEKASRYAAVWMGADEDEEIVYEGGVFSVKDSDFAEPTTFAEIARLAFTSHMRPEDEEPGLDEIVYYDPEGMSAPFGAHAAFVEVDIETGEVSVMDYVAVDDVGVVVNPMTASGQVHGGVVQGIGQALFEGAQYDDDGQLITGSLLDYALPKIDHLPMLRTAFLETPATGGPLGAKGVGEAGCCAAPPAMVQAVCDALSPFGISHIDMPLTAPKIRKAIRKAQFGVRREAAE